MYIQNVFHSNTGISQYRIEESNSPDAKVYTLYGQNELYEDLYGVPGAMSDRKQIKVDGMALLPEKAIYYLAQFLVKLQS